MDTVVVTAPPSDAEAQRSDQRQLKEIKVRLTLENTILENVLNYSNWTIYDNVFKYIVGLTTTCIYVM